MVNGYFATVTPKDQNVQILKVHPEVDSRRGTPHTQTQNDFNKTALHQKHYSIDLRPTAVTSPLDFEKKASRTSSRWREAETCPASPTGEGIPGDTASRREHGVTYFSGPLWVTRGPKPGSPRSTNYVMNRSMRERDTFLKIFPGYRIVPETTSSVNTTLFNYPKVSTEGIDMHKIDRTYTHKMDFMKRYTEEMIKVQSIQRTV